MEEMQKRDRSGKKKHVTKSTTSQPQEEFIEAKARPSRPERAASMPKESQRDRSG